MILVVGGLLLSVAVIAAGLVLFRFVLSLEPKQRIMLVVVLIVGAAYLVPKFIHGFMGAYRTAQEIRRQQGR